MKPIRLYDAPNWVRRKLETALSGQSALRFLFHEIQNAEHLPILVWDGPNALQPRREIFPGYKVGRKPPDPAMFANMDLLRDLLKLSKAIQIRCHGYEADDIIAKLVKQIEVEHIHTNDADLQALGIPTDREKPLPCEPHLIRTYKTLVGDPSDKIPGVKGFGPKSWEQLTAYDFDFEAETPVLDGFGLSQKHLDWMTENWDQVQAMWRIIGFIDVPDDIIEKGTVVGSNQPDEADRIMRQYLN